MSESNDDVWSEVTRRAAVSRFSGATADDDDILGRTDIGEALLNPNRSAGGAGLGGGPAGMPPMMMGGMGGGGGGGGAAGGGAKLGAGPAGPVAPEAAAAQPAASIPLTQSVAAQVPQAGVGAAQAPDLPGSGSPAGGGAPGAGAPEGGDSGLPAELTSSGAGPGGAPATLVAGVPGGPAAPPADGFSADPKVVRELSASWGHLADEMHGCAVPPQTEGLGLVTAVERSHQTLDAQLSMWLTGAVEEFDSLMTRLHDVAGQYEAAEEAGVAEARKGTGE